ncbi:hypothetical protein CTheo_3296 [Ceratobasidium theobromae]|uniref:Uncharacterized protein n=1 Tax=Ceratobasidium theobromae TaxID=1582974 RepID=A0A5N5QP03_9AGAM|nr:hypothetical protein CTheo_3296 [Ceratobasidium theobromae]
MSFLTRFLSNMTAMKESQATQVAEARPRRHERSHRNRHLPRHHSRYVSDSDETETELDDEPPSNSLMLDLGPDYSPKAMSTISCPSPPPRGPSIFFETDDIVYSPISSPQHVKPLKPSAVSQPHHKPEQYHAPSAAQVEADSRQQRGRSLSRSSSASHQRERYVSKAAAYGLGSQWVW